MNDVRAVEGAQHAHQLEVRLERELMADEVHEVSPPMRVLCPRRVHTREDAV